MPFVIYDYRDARARFTVLKFHASPSVSPLPKNISFARNTFIYKYKLPVYRTIPRRPREIYDRKHGLARLSVSILSVYLPKTAEKSFTSILNETECKR